jgi:hypothetical protein
MRVGLVTALALVISISVGSCVDNEVTLLVEHMKVMPSPPSCISSTGDEKAASGRIDLSIATGFMGYFYVSNHAMIREEYDNLRAETDGVIIDGMEVYVVSFDGALIGGSEYYEFELFIPPESSDIVPAIVMPASVTEELRVAYDCQTPEEWWYANVGPSLIGDFTLTHEEQDQIALPEPEYYDALYGKVRFLGHTQGGSELETPEFSFLIEPCCNCLIDWTNCYTICGMFCEEPEDNETCHDGASTGGDWDKEAVDCREITNNPNVYWEVTVIDMGVETEEIYDCDDCTGSGS